MSLYINIAAGVICTLQAIIVKTQTLFWREKRVGNLPTQDARVYLSSTL